MRCGSCKHWGKKISSYTWENFARDREPPPENVGVCNNGGLSLEQILRKKPFLGRTHYEGPALSNYEDGARWMHAKDTESGYDQDILTSADFGCVRFEAQG